jgi:succinyl-CoA synthetase alpha subunit
MSNEMYSVCARAADGVAEGIAIGGDAFPGSTLSDHCRRYQRMPAVKLIVVLGEIGGEDEYTLAAAMESKEITKPVVRGQGGRGGGVVLCAFPFPFALAPRCAPALPLAPRRAAAALLRRRKPETNANPP